MGKNRILKYIFAYNTEIKETMATLAYLIGNSKYTYLTQLENPENDAKELAEKLNSLGITTKTFYNQCGSEYAKILSTLEKDIKDYGGIIINSEGRTVEVDSKKIDLSLREYELLKYLVDNEGIALSRDKILNNVWNYDYFGDARTIDTHVKKLRSKLGEKGEYIKTIWGMGYKFEVD